MQKTVHAIIRALTGRKPSSLGNRTEQTVLGNRSQATVQKTVGSKPSVKNRSQPTVQQTIQPSVRLVIDLETGTVKVKL
jgi:hypothetical protein